MASYHDSRDKIVFKICHGYLCYISPVITMEIEILQLLDLRFEKSKIWVETTKKEKGGGEGKKTDGPFGE
ncbi:hypothetical protein TIFTF001_023804 [Ficus carica]|uniref:Uncharacterized protein n=1 Tax=Ficus carica TaxID=3494 RepID=A0AA88DK90_FICCA|nr:hypothetical protein TIFTF001_023804 [Ficus carica]